MGKRGNGEGSITRRKSGGWCAQYIVYTSEGRKRRTLYGKTRHEVAAKLSKALADREGGLTFDAGSLTLGEYMTRWLSDSVRGTVRVSTYERHEQLFRGHIQPALGRLKLNSLTPRRMCAGLSARSWKLGSLRLPCVRSTPRSTKRSPRGSRTASFLATPPM